MSTFFLIIFELEGFHKNELEAKDTFTMKWEGTVHLMPNCSRPRVHCYHKYFDIEMHPCLVVDVHHTFGINMMNKDRFANNIKQPHF